MSGSTWIALGSLIATFVTAGGGAAVVVHTIRSNRNKPALDASNTNVAQATVQRMMDESNAVRDTRLWQLESYLNLDSGWHFDVMRQYRIQNATLKRLIEMLREAGIDLGDIVLPADELPTPPPIPEPPRRG